MVTVKDCMTPVVLSATLDYSMEEIEQLMDRHKLHFLPIIDSDLECVGVISVADLIHWHNIKENAGQAKAFCSQPAIKVNPNLLLIDAVKLMLSNDISHLVVSQGDELVGVLSPRDVFEKYVLQRMG